MKYNLLVIGGLFCTALAAQAAGSVLSGQVQLSNGASPAQGVILYRPAWQGYDVKGAEVPLAKSGQFEIEIAKPDAYFFVFAHPGFEPQELRVNFMSHPRVKIKVLLDRYSAATKGAYSLVTSENQFDMRNPRQLMLKDGAYQTQFAASKPVQYQIVANGRSFNGLDPVSGYDAAGDFISEAKPVNGLVTIAFDPQKLGLRKADSKGKIANIEGAQLLLSRQQFQKTFMEYMPLVREKYRKKDMSIHGLEPLLTLGQKLVERQTGERDQLLMSLQVDTALGVMSDAFDVKAQVAKMLITEPDLLAQLSAQEAVRMSLFLEKERGKTKVKRKEGFAIQVKALERYLNHAIPSDQRLFALVNLSYIADMAEDDGGSKWREQLLKEFPDSREAQTLVNRNKQKTLRGTTAPALVLNNANGEEVSLKSLRGKYVLLDFWATWCAPCIEEIPNLKRAYSKMDKQRIEFVSVCLDAENKKLARAVKKFKMDWVQLGAGGKSADKVSEDYQITFIPSIFLIGPDGKILRHNDRLRGPELETTLKQTMAPQP